MPPVSYRFGPFQLDIASYSLIRDGAELPQPPKILDLLALFASRPNELITKEEIFERLWPDVAVTDNAITQVVSGAREALGDNPAAPIYIQTVPRRGYRFIASVTAAGTRGEAAAQPSTHTSPPVRRVAVSDFRNVTGDVDTAWLGAGIAETLTNDLRGLRDLRVIDRSALPPAVRDGDLTAAREAHLDLLIVGSFQRADRRVRITGRAVDVTSHESTTHAKVDGPLDDVFGLQDQVVTQLLNGLQVAVSPAAAARIGVRETSSLEAYQALTEGRLKLDSLDPDQVPGAIADFTRAIDLDPQYALAHVGLGHAHFWLHQRTRLMSRPSSAHLDASVAHVRKAIGLDHGLAEAHAALALFLANTEDAAEAVGAGRTAVLLEPHDWRHRFRLSVATWGSERLACLREVHRLYPGFAFGYFGGAMVHVARGDLAEAARTLDDGVQVERQWSRAGSIRFPGNGLHWLRGLIHLSQGSVRDARLAFDRELSIGGSTLYADEYAVNACDGHGFVLTPDDPMAAIEWFMRALELVPDHARTLIGLAAAYRKTGRSREADAALARARECIDDLTTARRRAEAAMALAHWHIVAGRPEDAIEPLDGLVTSAPQGIAGWTIPVEPWLQDLRSLPSFAPVLRKLAARAV